MTQLGINQGIKRFGKEGVDAVQAEMKQLHNRAVLKPVVASQLSLSEKKASLQYLMFLKQNGRCCADSRKQRLITRKENASAPTVSVEALMFWCAIDVKAGRDIATVDIPGAFMQKQIWTPIWMNSSRPVGRSNGGTPGQIGPKVV